MPVCHTHLGHVACFFDSTINSVSDRQTKSIPKVIQGESESKESNKKDSLVCVHLVLTHRSVHSLSENTTKSIPPFSQQLHKSNALI